MPLQRLLWSLVAIAAITAYAIGADHASTGAPPSATRLATLAGCPDPVPVRVTGAYEALGCKESGYDVVVVTFETNTQRDHWFDEQRPLMFMAQMQGLSGALVAGDRWGILTDDVERATELKAVANGWWV
ncbi:hypothetical protein ACQP00_23045 [Dactylosporangium sp. CS-047395]|uniref:hypothetical protein n=1 Tax=Dactylosporangium sp. CS-047395 TaxID=3239936 RepID=UPI003D943010